MEERLLTPEAFSTTSAFSKIFNTYTEPSSVFEEVTRQEKTTSNWLLPAILCIVAGIVFTFVVFSDPVIKQEMRYQQLHKMQEKVANGEMTQEQYDRAVDFIPEPGSTIFLVTGIGGVIVVTFLSLLIVALVMMLAGKMFLQTQATFGKIMEVVGLSYSVFIIGGIVSILTIKIGGSMSKTPSAAFFLNAFDTNNAMHHLLKFADVFSFWYVFVLAIGLSKLFQKPLGSVIGIVFGLWLVYAVGFSFVSAM
ncbi:MAG: YIP1 family protein [Ignavibacteria bacterium]|nr:YIP1 family protein [Ignavibacteria bacterium]